jgi:riboflavin synthase
MFTGIIESTGKIISVKKESSNLRLQIECPFTGELKVDQSISHNGVCLTVEKVLDGSYEVVAIGETLQRSNLGHAASGDIINLERCMKIGDRLDGHMVQGHVDETAVCKSVEDKEGSWIFNFRINEASGNLIVEKGSICVSGVSLTVVDAGRDFFSVAIIPYTFENTNFRLMKPGSVVNLEYDIIGKYVERVLSSQKIFRH